MKTTLLTTLIAATLALSAPLALAAVPNGDWESCRSANAGSGGHYR